jgi:hypothetical protein
MVTREADVNARRAAPPRGVGPTTYADVVDAKNDDQPDYRAPRPPSKRSRSESFMPFGEFKGLPISHLADDYIVGLASWPVLRDPLKSGIEAEVAKRGLAEQVERAIAKRRGRIPPAVDQEQ